MTKMKVTKIFASWACRPCIILISVRSTNGPAYITARMNSVDRPRICSTASNSSRPAPPLATTGIETAALTAAVISRS